MGNNSFTLISFFYSLMLVVLYFKRQKIITSETKIYSGIVRVNFLNIIFAIVSYYTITFSDKLVTINNFVSKSLLIFFVSWVIFFTIYLLYITDKNKNNYIDKIMNNKLYIMLYILFIFVVFSLPLYYHNDNMIIYSYGPSANFSYFIGGSLIFFWVIKIIINFQVLKNKKIIPIVLFIFLAVIVVTIQKLRPELLLMTAAETFITFVMFFTIENPDMKLLEEVHRSKEVSDAANEEKTLFLYNMTQEIRGITSDINYDADIILDSKDWEETYDSARDIKATTSKFNSITNELLDVSNVDSSTIKVYNSKYNLKNLLKQMVNVYGDLCNNKMLKFITNIDHDIPEELYGDLINLKEVLNTILSNSVKYTNKGFVELSVNTIIKNDICRLIITVEDSGVGIKSEDINKIKLDNKSLAKANNLITVMHGAMMISSNYGVGTKVKVILDQKIETQDNTEIDKYESTFDDVNIICVDDSEAGLKIIDKLLKGTNIKIDFVNTGKECLNSLRVNKYDLVLLDEELEQETGIELMQKIKEIRNFRTPVIFLTKDNSYEYNEEYAKVGFADYILKPIKKEQLMEKIDKYTKKDNK